MTVALYLGVGPHEISSIHSHTSTYVVIVQIWFKQSCFGDLKMWYTYTIECFLAADTSFLPGWWLVCGKSYMWWVFKFYHGSWNSSIPATIKTLLSNCCAFTKHYQLFKRKYPLAKCQKRVVGINDGALAQCKLKVNRKWMIAYNWCSTFIQNLPYFHCCLPVPFILWSFTSSVRLALYWISL